MRESQELDLSSIFPDRRELTSGWFWGVLVAFLVIEIVQTCWWCSVQGSGFVFPWPFSNPLFWSGAFGGTVGVLVAVYRAPNEWVPTLDGMVIVVAHLSFWGLLFVTVTQRAWLLVPDGVWLEPTEFAWALRTRFVAGGHWTVFLLTAAVLLQYRLPVVTNENTWRCYLRTVPVVGLLVILGLVSWGPPDARVELDTNNRGDAVRPVDLGVDEKR